MKLLKCVLPVYCDIDDTIILWSPSEEQIRTLGIAYNGGKIVPNYPQIEALRKHKLRGHTIILWSAGGWAWAWGVAKVLKLDDIVDFVVEKPRWVYDDLKVEDFMPKSQLVKE